MGVAIDPDVSSFLAKADDLTKAILIKVADESAVSGWSLAKMLNRNPESVETSLGELQQKQLIKSNGDGLEGMYYLTQLGYLSRDLF